MPSPQFQDLLSQARADVLDRIQLSVEEKEFIEREALNLIDEWFNARRAREWRQAEMSAESLPALFAVMTHCFDAAARRNPRWPI